MRLARLLRGVAHAVGLGMASAGSVQAEGQAGVPAVGDVLLCPSDDGRPAVLAWVGRVEAWADHGVEDERGRVGLTHLQLQVEGGALDRAAHAPFEASALRGCVPAAAGAMTPNPAAFEEGYGIWLEAVTNDGAGAFTLGPADAYWAVIGIRDGAMGS